MSAFWVWVGEGRGESGGQMMRRGGGCGEVLERMLVSNEKDRRIDLVQKYAYRYSYSNTRT